MSQNKTLELRKTSIGNKGLFLYEVVEEGKVLTSRRTNRDYVACFVLKGDSGKFYAPTFFGRLDLIGKGDSRFYPSHPTFYATAFLTKSQANDITS